MDSDDRRCNDGFFSASGGLADGVGGSGSSGHCALGGFAETVGGNGIGRGIADGGITGNGG